MANEKPELKISLSTKADKKSADDVKKILGDQTKGFKLLTEAAASLNMQLTQVKNNLQQIGNLMGGGGGGRQQWGPSSFVPYRQLGGGGGGFGGGWGGGGSGRGFGANPGGGGMRQLPGEKLIGSGFSNGAGGGGRGGGGGGFGGWTDDNDGSDPQRRSWNSKVLGFGKNVAGAAQIVNALLGVPQEVFRGMDASNQQFASYKASQGIAQEYKIGKAQRDWSSTFALYNIMSDPKRRAEYTALAGPNRRWGDAVIGGTSKIAGTVAGATLMGFSALGLGASILTGDPITGAASLGGLNFGRSMTSGKNFMEGVNILSDDKTREMFIQKNILENQKQYRDNTKSATPEQLMGLNTYTQGASTKQDLQRRLFGGMSAADSEQFKNGKFPDYISNVGWQYMDPTTGSPMLSTSDKQAVLSNLTESGTTRNALNATNQNTAIDMNIRGLSPGAAAQFVGAFSNASVKLASAMGQQLSGALGDARIKEQLGGYEASRAYNTAYGTSGAMGLQSFLMSGDALNRPNTLTANISADTAFSKQNTYDSYAKAYGQVQDIKFANKYSGGDINMAYALDRLRASPNFNKTILSSSVPDEFKARGMTLPQWRAFQTQYDPRGFATILARRPDGQDPRANQLARILKTNGGSFTGKGIHNSDESIIATLIQDAFGADFDTALSEVHGLRHPGAARSKRITTSNGKDKINVPIAPDASLAGDNGAAAVINQANKEDLQNFRDAIKTLANIKDFLDPTAIKNTAENTAESAGYLKTIANAKFGPFGHTNTPTKTNGNK